MARLASALALGVFGAAALGAAASGARAGAAACPAAVRAARDLGQLALIRSGRLELLDLAGCRVRTLVASGASAPLRWSADRRYLGFGDGAVVAVGGGTVSYPLGPLAAGFGSDGSPGWAWAPTGHELAGVDRDGGVVAGGPGRAPRALLPRGFGATSVAFSPDGRALAVSRSLYLRVPPPYAQQIWLVELASGKRRELLRLPAGELAPPWLSGFSPNGRWLLAWEDSQNSASLAADGLPLVAVPTAGGAPVAVGGGSLVYGDFLSWCGSELALVVNRGGREVTLGDRIGLARPPRFSVGQPAAVAASARLSFVSPACSPDGRLRIAAAVGPATDDEPLGGERRRIWLLDGLRAGWRPLEQPAPRGSTDELPLWSADGRWLAFVRTTWVASAGVGVGRLYLLAVGATGAARAPIGPLATIGEAANDDGHYDWGSLLAWASG